MMRDTFFSLPRFVHLCRKELIENWKVNLLRTMMIFGVFLIAFIWGGYFQYNEMEGRNQTGGQDPFHLFETLVFLWGIMIMGCLSASFCMERMKSKTSRIAILMTPATMFEKYISRWLLCTIAFLMAYLIAFKLADWIRVVVFSIKYPEMDFITSVSLMQQLVGPSQGWTAFNDGSLFLLGISSYLACQSSFVLGSSIWPKNAFLKTFAAGMVISVLYALIGGMLVKMLFFDQMIKPDFASEETVICLTTIFCFAVALFNWVLAYFRFKESEIITRW